MTEPRARQRTKGATFEREDLAKFLWAHGDNFPLLASGGPNNPGALPKTLDCLDEIITDFIIETCHYAALSASYSRRQKIKVDDFKFVLRRDERLLGRVLEQLWREKRIKEQRQTADFNQLGDVGAVGMGALEGVAAAGGVQESELKERKRGRGRGKRKRKDKEGDAEDGRKTKRVAT